MEGVELLGASAICAGCSGPGAVAARLRSATACIEDGVKEVTCFIGTARPRASSCAI